MTDSELLRDLKVAWEYAHEHDDWVAPLEEELAGLTAEQAAWHPAPEAKSIWEIVLHMTVWNEDIVARVESGQKSHPPEGAWPPMPDVADEKSWESARDRLRKSIRGVAELFDADSMRKINASSYGLPDLLVRYIHMGYHIGQITKLREEQVRPST
jgi:hypothetical protein